MVECPGCGISMVSFKNRFAHIKKCFSIKRRGPLYRIHGYAECKCGFLIADTEKARKLHCCSVNKQCAFDVNKYYKVSVHLGKTSPLQANHTN